MCVVDDFVPNSFLEAGLQTPLFSKLHLATNNNYYHYMVTTNGILVAGNKMAIIPHVYEIRSMAVNFALSGNF